MKSDVNDKKKQYIIQLMEDNEIAQKFQLNLRQYKADLGKSEKKEVAMKFSKDRSQELKHSAMKRAREKTATKS